MELQEAVAKLQAAGFVTRDFSRTPEETYFFIGREVEPVDAEEAIFKFKYMAAIYLKNGRWGFRKWDAVPGPGYDDIDFQSASLEIIFAAAMTYYFGEPVFIDGWSFPIQKHPEWERDRLPELLASAKALSSQEWQVLHDKHPRNGGRCILMEHWQTFMPTYLSPFSIRTTTGRSCKSGVT